MKQRPVLLLLIMIMSGLHPAAQNRRDDSLYVFSLINKAEDHFTESNYDSALYYCGLAAGYSREKNYRKGQAFALIETADIYIEKDELVKANSIAESVVKTGQLIKDSLVTAVGWMQQAQVQMYSDRFDAAIPLFERSLQFYLDKNPTRYSALAYNDLGYTWGRKGELSKQAECLVKSIRIYETYFPDKYGELGAAYNNLSTVYYGLNDRNRAIEYAKKSLQYREKSGDVSRLSIGCCNISQYYTGINNEEAEKYLQLCVKYALQSKVEQRIIHSYVTAANLYYNNNKVAEAYDYEQKAISALEKSNRDQAMLARRYMAAAISANRLGKDSALVLGYFSKSMALLSRTNDRANLRDLYYQLSTYYTATNNFAAAYDHYRKYILYRDSIVSDNTKSSIAEINTRYETEKKDKEIIRLNTAQQIRQLEIEKQRAVIEGNAALALQKQNEIDLLSKTKELQEARISQQEEELVKKELIATANQQQLQLANKEKQLQERTIRNQKNFRNFLLAGLGLFLLLGYLFFNRYQLKKKLEQQESLLAMRNHISQDLHDDIGASLSNINILNELARRNLSQPEKSAGYLSKASEDIQRISESLSDIVWNINPRYDQLDTLFVRMKRYAADMFDGKNIGSRFEFPETESGIQLSMTQRRDLYLIFKEAVNNLVKYSGATEALVKLTTDNHQLQLLITDNGKGFDRTSLRAGNGLHNMEQRAAAAGGSLFINSVPGEGTRVELQLKLS
jgi:signal transduction histidine kinase